MSYQEEDSTKLKRQSSKQAIALAMEGRWREAIAANQSLIESFPNDVDAYNRLGRAHMELGEYSLARQAYQKTIEIDPYNTIAQKNLNRLSLLNEGADAGTDYGRVEPQQFIEEVGKAGVMSLIRIGTPEILARTVDGSRANLKAVGQQLVVENVRGEYLGQVEPRFGQRLVRLINGGNKYSATVISSTERAVSVIVREIYQHPSQAGQLSFPFKTSESSRITDRLGDMLIRRNLEHIEDENALPGETGYAIVDRDGEDMDVLTDDDSDDMDDIDDDE